MKKLLSILVLSAAFAVAALMPSPAAAATTATSNLSAGQGDVVVFPFHISGQYTATTASVVKFNMPFACHVLGVSATARASGGTSPTLQVDVLEAATTILSAKISVTAGTVSFGTVSDASIADEAAVTVGLTIGGTSPTWNDITVLITCARQ